MVAFLMASAKLWLMNPVFLSWPAAFLLGVGSIVDLSGATVVNTDILSGSSTLDHSFLRVGGYLSNAFAADVKAHAELKDKNQLELFE